MSENPNVTDDLHRSYSYGEIAELMNRTGNALRNLGGEMESRVLLLLHDSPRFVAVLVARKLWQLMRVAMPAASVRRLIIICTLA